MNDRTKTLGILGGMGPAATAYFMDLVISMTDADTDQAHLDMVVASMPSIPDRTAYILDCRKESPVPAIIDCGKRLVTYGAGVLAMPCITAHYFLDPIRQAVCAPMIDAVEETLAELKRRGIVRAGIMATSGTLHAGIFQEKMEKMGMEAILPSPDRQKDVMDLIYQDIKTGRPADMDRFARVTDQLRQRGAQVIILGCTELSIIKRDCPIGPGFIDVLEVLAKTSVESCGGAVREAYRNMISQ